MPPAHASPGESHVPAVQIPSQPLVYPHENIACPAAQLGVQAPIPHTFGVPFGEDVVGAPHVLPVPQFPHATTTPHRFNKTPQWASHAASSKQGPSSWASLASAVVPSRTLVLSAPASPAPPPSTAYDGRSPRPVRSEHPTIAPSTTSEAIAKEAPSRRIRE
jgi:hypothetical protein